ncbi:MAG: penicillin-binding transpeptidase domain-containing protein, partial [Nitriliruptorales bacterium]
ASPLHMASVAAAVAAGRWQQPMLVADQEAAGAGEPLPEVETLRELMRLVVTDGTGTAADVDGREVRGKTGTAEFGTPDEEGELPTHAWFIGYAGDLAFAVVVEGGGGGGEVAAPIGARFLTALET